MRQLSLRSRRLEVVGIRRNARSRRRHVMGEGGSLNPRVSPSRAPVLSFAHYFQAPATQATNFAHPLFHFSWVLQPSQEKF